MPQAVLVTSPRQPDSLRELADTLRYELELQAIPSAVHAGSMPEEREGQVAIVLDPAEFVAAEGDRQLGEDVARRAVFICATVAGLDEHVELLRRGGAVFALDQRAVLSLQRHGIRARLLRPGYSASRDRFDPDAARSIDVAFMGLPVSRQAVYLERAADVLSRYDCALGGPGSDDDGPNRSTPSVDRWAVLTDSRVVINIHSDERTRLEWPLVLDAIHAGAVVVSEHSSGIAPLVAGEHLLVGAPDSLPFLADVLLRDPERIAAIRARAYERLREWIPFALWVSVLRAAIVELVGEPISKS